MTRFRLRILGRPVLEAGQDPEEVVLRPGKPLALLIYLAIKCVPVSRDELAELLWFGTDRRHSRASVRQALWTLRRELGEDVLQGEETVSLNTDLIATDLEDFWAALKRGDVDLASEFWTGPPLQEMQFPGAREWDRWAEELRTGEEERFGSALAQAAGRATQEGELGAAKAYWKRAIAVEAGRASHHFDLVQCLLDFHDLDGAEAAILAGRRVLDDPESREAFDGLTSQLLAQRREALRDLEPHALRPEFVGRSPEFSTLSRLWKEVQDGPRRCAVILGPAGIGKTRLAEELGAFVTAAGGRTIRVKATPVEGSLPWSTLGEVARELHQLPGAAGISGRSSHVLTRLLPSLDRGAERTRKGGPGLSRASEQTALTDAFRDLVAAVAEEEPLLLVVDDLHWVDRKSLAAVVQCIRSLPHSPVLFVLISRTEGQSPSLASTLEGLTKEEWVREVPLSPLIEAEVAELLALMLEPADPQTLGDFAAQVHGITGGNPLFVTELLKLLQAEGYLESAEGGRWNLDPRWASTPLPVPGTIEAAIERRVKNLSAAARALAAHLAHLPRPEHPQRLRQRAGLADWEMIGAVEEMTERDLVRRDARGHLSFVHDTVREVASRTFPPPVGNGFIPGIGRVPSLRAGLWGVGIAGLAAGLVLGGVMHPFSGAGDEARLPDARLAVLRTGEDGGQERVEALIRRNRVSFRRLPPPAPEPLSPDGRWMAMQARGPTGSHVSFRNLDTGEARALTGDGADHNYETFSPDSRRVLFRESETFNEGRGYRRVLGIYDLAAGRGRRIPSETPLVGHDASWSPDGTRIAFLTEGGNPPSVCVSDLEGTDPWCVPAEGEASPSRPTWSSDGARLAVALADPLNSGILVLSPSERRSTRIGEALEPLSHPVWLTESVIACVAGHPGEGDLWTIDIGGVVPRVMQLSHAENLIGIDGVSPLDPPERWIESVSIEPRASRVSPGQYVPLRGVLERAGGGREDPHAFPIRWEVSDPRLASVSDSGLVRILGEGTVTVTANAGGWRTGSLTLTAVPPTRQDLPLLFEEDWSEGLREEVWRPYGSPPPFVRNARDTEGISYFVNNGDGNYESGAVSVQSFPAERGLSLLVQAELGFDGGLFQDFLVGFVSDPTPDPEGERYMREGDIRLMIEAVDPLTRLSFGSVPQLTLPLPNVEGWREYGLQLEADQGVVSVVVDGGIFWRSEPGTWAPSPGEDLFLILGTRSEGTEVKHGRVRVFEGVKYVVSPPAVTPPRAGAAGTG